MRRFADTPLRCALACLHLFLGFDVLDCSGLEPAAMVRQAEETVLRERLMPEDFHGEFPVRRAAQNARMKNADAGDDVRRVGSFQPMVFPGLMNKWSSPLSWPTARDLDCASSRKSILSSSQWRASRASAVSPHDPQPASGRLLRSAAEAIRPSR